MRGPLLVGYTVRKADVGVGLWVWGCRGAVQGLRLHDLELHVFRRRALLWGLGWASTCTYNAEKQNSPSPPILNLLSPPKLKTFSNMSPYETLRHPFKGTSYQSRDPSSKARQSTGLRLEVEISYRFRVWGLLNRIDVGKYPIYIYITIPIMITVLSNGGALGFRVALGNVEQGY